MNYKKIKTNFLVGTTKLLVKLPLFVILKLGALLGLIFWYVPNKRKIIATRNIELCFPELSQKHQQKLAKQNLISTGIGFVEMILSYWGNTNKFIDKFDIVGLENVEQALAKQHGCILLSCHLHPMELATRVINANLKQPAYILGRQHNNKILEEFIDNARKQHCEKTIDKKDLRTVLKSFKNNRCIFYIPDQNFSYQCEYIDFFNLPAATVIAPVKIAQSSKAAVVPWFCFRENGRWKINLLPALDYFHDEEINTSLTKMNNLFEQQIRNHPEQYLWVHRRFKNHPKGKNFLYT